MTIDKIRMNKREAILAMLDGEKVVRYDCPYCEYLYWCTISLKFYAQSGTPFDVNIIDSDCQRRTRN